MTPRKGFTQALSLSMLLKSSPLLRFRARTKLHWGSLQLTQSYLEHVSSKHHLLYIKLGETYDIYTMVTTISPCYVLHNKTKKTIIVKQEECDD